MTSALTIIVGFLSPCSIHYKKMFCIFTWTVYICKRLVWDSGVTLDWHTVSHRTGADFFKEQHQAHTWLVCGSRINTYSVLGAAPIFNSVKEKTLSTSNERSNLWIHVKPYDTKLNKIIYLSQFKYAILNAPFLIF